MIGAWEINIIFWVNKIYKVLQRGKQNQKSLSTAINNVSLLLKALGLILLKNSVDQLLF